MTSNSANSNTFTASEVLGALLEEVTEKAQAGEKINLEQYIKDYPQHAEELRQLMPTISVLLDMADASVAGNSAKSPIEQSDDPARGIIGDYRIIQEVGRGGMGVVYEAEQLSLSRRVALKVLPFAAMLDKRQMARFQNEAHAAASLTHQHIVPVYAIGCERGVHYYAMQFVEGHPLDRVIAELREQADVVNVDSTRLSQVSNLFLVGTTPGECEQSDQNTEFPSLEKTNQCPDLSDGNTVPLANLSTEKTWKRNPYFQSVAQIGIQAAEALDYAHQHGVIHRDIKPSNLMLDQACNLWLTDFGLARIEANPGMTMTGDLIGTLRYMSPEQALAKRVVIDHRTDVYSLGATLYELLTLRPAIEGKDHQELLKRIAFEDPIPPRRIDNSIPADLETILLTSLAKNPEERYGTARYG